MASARPASVAGSLGRSGGRRRVDRVRVAVLNYRGAEDTIRCLDHLAATTWPGTMDVWVIDNASGDGSLDAIRSAHPGVSVLPMDENVGYPANNVALTDLDGVDAVALLNNDVRVEPGWLTPLADALEADPGLASASPLILFDRPRVRRLDLEGSGVVRLGTITVEGVQIASPAVSAEAGRHSFVKGALQVELPCHIWIPTSMSGGDSHPDQDPSEPDPRGAVRDRPTTGPDVVVEWSPVTTEARLTGHSRLAPLDHAVHLVQNAGSRVTPDGVGENRGFLEPEQLHLQQRDVPAWCGAAVLLASDALEVTGQLEPAFFLYYEDLDLAYRAGSLGWRHRLIPEARVWHRHSATIGSGSPLAQRQHQANRMLFVVRNFPTNDVRRIAARWALDSARGAANDLLVSIGRRERTGPSQTRARIEAILRLARLPRTAWRPEPGTGRRSPSIGDQSGPA